MSKLSFRARALDASKPMPIYMAEELPDLPDYSAINRAVPQMPSGMEKEEECEHHLQRAICAGLIIPTPEVADIPQKEYYDKVYPANYKQPRQLIHMQPFTMEQDIPDYDMDSEDEVWLQSQAQRLELSPLKFEEMMDRLEKSSGQTVVTINEAKALLKEDDDLIIAVFDYWLNKRLQMQHPLILSVKTEHRTGLAANNPYLAFRRRTEKMQTRKNRKNDEVSYEKMLKLKRDFLRALTLLELVKRREKTKREHVHLTVEIFEKRYHAKDYSGAVLAEVSSIKSTRPAFTPIFHNHYTNQTWSNKSSVLKDEGVQRKEKRQYKKRKHKSMGHSRTSGVGTGLDIGNLSSDEEPSMQVLSPEPDEVDDEGQFAFRRNKLCSYHMPLPTEGNWSWCAPEENGLAEKKYRYTLTSLSRPRRCIGFARRRVGRGGRVILDRARTESDDFWRSLDFTILDGTTTTTNAAEDDRTAASVAESNGDQSTNCLTNISSSINATNIISDRTDGNFNCNFVVDTNNPTNLLNNIRTDVKSEFDSHNASSGSSVNLRTSEYNVCGSEYSEVKVEIKMEPEDLEEIGVAPLDPEINSATLQSSGTANEDDRYKLELLQSIRREWLHFRPKTPPPDYEPLCHLLPAEDSYLKFDALVPFTMEIQTFEAPSTLLDSSVFESEPFLFDSTSMDCLDIPITDTRQQPSPPPQQPALQPLPPPPPPPPQSSDNKIVQTGINLNVNVGLNTLNTSTFSSNSCSNNNNSNNSNDNSTSLFNVNDIKYENYFVDSDSSSSGEESRTGCSQFFVSDLGASTSTSGMMMEKGTSYSGDTLSSSDTSSRVATTTTRRIDADTSSGSRKFNSSNLVSVVARPPVTVNKRSSATVVGDGSLSNSNGILSQCGYEVSSGRTKNNKLSYAYSGGMGYPNSTSGTLSLHTSAHTLTLNSHSANIFEIPMSNNTNAVSGDLVSSPCTEAGNGTQPNNKNKTIVRKTNLVMEVT